MILGFIQAVIGGLILWLICVFCKKFYTRCLSPYILKKRKDIMKPVNIISHMEPLHYLGTRFTKRPYPSREWIRKNKEAINDIGKHKKKYHIWSVDANKEIDELCKKSTELEKFEKDNHVVRSLDNGKEKYSGYNYTTDVSKKHLEMVRKYTDVVRRFNTRCDEIKNIIGCEWREKWNERLKGWFD